MRTVALLRFLADSGLRARVTAAPTRPRPTTGSPPGPRFGNQGVIAENDPAEQGKSVKWNSLLCNLIVFHTAIDMMEVIRQPRREQENPMEAIVQARYGSPDVQGATEGTR